MISRHVILSGMCLWPRLVVGYPEQYGPFLTNEIPTPFPIALCTAQKQRTEPGFTRPTTRVYGRTGNLVRIRLELDTRTYAVLLSVMHVNGRLIHGPEPVCGNIEWGDMGPVYSADMNRDGIPDFVAFIWRGGCGLASGYHDLAFVLSDKEEYQVTVVTTLFPTERDFVDLSGDGSCHFIRTRLMPGKESENGEQDDYWGYDIFAMEGATLRLRTDNELFP